MRVLKLIFLLYVVTAQAQQPNINSKVKLGNYIFTSAFQTNYITDFNGKKEKEEKIIHKVGNIVNAIKTLNDSTLIIQYYKSKVYPDKNKKSKDGLLFNQTYFNDKNTLKYFKIF